jgi:hypothetical protein
MPASVNEPSGSPAILLLFLMRRPRGAPHAGDPLVIAD